MNRALILFAATAAASLAVSAACLAAVPAHVGTAVGRTADCGLPLVEPLWSRAAVGRTAIL